jgi:hypothetical protein
MFGGVYVCVCLSSVCGEVIGLIVVRSALSVWYGSVNDVGVRIGCRLAGCV